MGTRFPLQELDPLGQRRLAGAQSPSPHRVPDPRFEPPCRHPKVKLPQLQMLRMSSLTNHFSLCLLNS